MSKENRKLNDIERMLLGKMKTLESFRKFADELLLELISTGTIQQRAQEEIDSICVELYKGLEELDAKENEDKRSNTH